MSNRHKEFAEQLRTVRDSTRTVITSILMDSWPSHAGIVDFGIESQKHYEALYYPIREAEILPKTLDAALGHGEKLTALTREAPSNPHKDITFSTSWDVILGRQWQGPKNDMQDFFKEPEKVVEQETSKKQDLGIER